MKRFCIFAILVILAINGAAVSLHAQKIVTPVAAERFYGVLDAELAPDLVHVYQRVFEVKAARPRFTPDIDAKAVVSQGEIYDQRVPSGKSEMLLVELAAGDAFVAVDLNSNGAIEFAERFPLKKLRPDSSDLETIVRLPLSHPFYKNYPVLILYKRGFKHPKLGASDWLILQSTMALAYGTVDVKGRGVRFQYPFDSGAPSISTTEGLFGIDADGDGKIRDEQFSPESSYAAKAETVFRLGNQYVSTEKVDLAKNLITVRTRVKEEYLRHDIEVGKPMPDFSFIDLEGKKRSLYEFKGKYLLVDFWGAWCFDCTIETPFHVEAIKQFRSRGFDILSLNTDEKIETAKSYIAKNNMPWTQARNESIRELIEVTYRIQEYPSTILIGPDSKVLVLDQNQLRGRRLLATLDQILPK